MKNTYKTALVTGGTGFIGSHLVESLLKDGWKVRCLIRETSSRRFLNQDNIEFSIGTLDDKASLRSSFKGVNTVFHLAGKIKGDSRPIIPQEERVEVLAALQCVDLVVLFNEPNPYCLYSCIHPHIIVKGGDWENKVIIGWDIIEPMGGRAVCIPTVEGVSTSNIIDKIIKCYLREEE